MTCLSVLEKIKINKSDVERYIEYVHSVEVYQKYLTRLGELEIFDIRQHFVRVLYFCDDLLSITHHVDKRPVFPRAILRAHNIA